MVSLHASGLCLLVIQSKHYLRLYARNMFKIIYENVLKKQQKWNNCYREWLC